MNFEPANMNHGQFLGIFGSVFEHSTWIAENVWHARQGPGQDPNKDHGRDSATSMHEAMCGQIRQADRRQQLELLRAHPELACAVSSEDLTSASRHEQSRSGLDQCKLGEFAEFQRLNELYRDKFGFPFILAIKGFQRGEILEIFRSRLQHSADEEFQNALAEVMKIGLFRLQDIYA